MLDSDDPRLIEASSRLSPYARSRLERAGVHALCIHADEVAREHLLGILMDDESSAAYAAVEHAFADPETIRAEALAISPGLMMVASNSTRPFSTLAVDACHAAREGARARGVTEVESSQLALEGARHLEPECRTDLETAGYSERGLLEQRGSESTSESVLSTEGHLFRHFSSEAKQVLSNANRLAAELREPAIAPAHLLLAALRVGQDLGQRAGIGYGAARSVLFGRTRDDSPPRPRRLAAADELIEFLAGLPRGAGSLEILAHFHNAGPAELAQILERHKVTRPLLERSQGAFEDPQGD